jgi:hypothetical protein
LAVLTVKIWKVKNGQSLREQMPQTEFEQIVADSELLSLERLWGKES